MRQSIRILVVTAAALGASGCEKRVKPKAEAERTKSAPTTAARPAPPTVVDTAKPGAANATVTSTPQKPPEVKLLSPGGMPRKQLRLHPKAGSKETLVMTMRTGMEVKIQGMANPPIKLPPMRMTMAITVKSVSPQGDLAYDFVLKDAEVLDEPGVMPQVAAQMKAALASTKGISGTGSMTNRGFNKGTSINVPPKTDPQVRQIIDGMRDSFNQIAAPLPAEPIGPGGKWEVKMNLVQNGMSLEQIATYEVTKLKGDTLFTKNTVQQRAGNQQVKNPTMPQLKMELVKLVADGGGGMTMNLASILPSTANAKIKSEAQMVIDMGSQKQNMSMKMDLDLKVEGK